MTNDEAALILRGVLSLSRRLRVERADGAASPAAISLLAALHRLGPVPAVRLAAEQRLQPQSLTRLIAGLERELLISRTANPEDGRELLIAITRRGRGLLAADMRDRRRWLETAMADSLTATEQAGLLAAADAMLKLANHATNAEAPA